MKSKITIGGQAVIEGVMMRGPGYIATAVREPSGSIVVSKEPLTSLTDRYPLLKKPLLRGVVALVESLVYGLKALSFSAQAAGEEEEALSGRDIAMTMVLSFGLAILLFVVIPTYAAKFLHGVTADARILNLMEGLLRLAIFIAYIYGISLLKDIQRVFQYHGAEHKTIHAFEAGAPLDVEHVRAYSTLHPRCGTNFLLIVMVVSIIVFAFLGWPDLWLRILSRILLLPVIAGISYEIIRFAGRSDKRWVSCAIAPGLWLQKLTTREPSDDQIEVAIRALEAVKPDDPAATTEEVNANAG
ncbi:DUF1385 domain-containing protein [Sporolituus thermophilus]|uniref:Uncharacterized conserved protein YqhQ n=1 Tax=Sporolituus thermophilus DSM 23256 TaxID=1123285 RepID=A0A1G7HJG8_9FIRM|nr:DUF1385 domain-containing protein [Sporolituus thermophilus]SDF00647.1 Uncharacterized conserved protein YqhQ [Sporolituus thermophilus DSM 23256]